MAWWRSCASVSFSLCISLLAWRNCRRPAWRPSPFSCSLEVFLESCSGDGGSSCMGESGWSISSNDCLLGLGEPLMGALRPSNFIALDGLFCSLPTRDVRLDGFRSIEPNGLGLGRGVASIDARS